MSRQQWQHQHAHHCQLARCGGITVLLLGDSLTAGWPSRLWDAHFAPLGAANFAIGGDHTGNLLWRLQHLPDGPLQPNLVVLLAGINNLLHLQETPEQASAGMTEVIRQLRRRFPLSRLLLQGLLPCQPSPGDPLRQWVTDLNMQLSALADEKMIFFRDYGQHLLTREGQISTELMADYLHPTDAGYERWLTPLLADIRARLA